MSLLNAITGSRHRFAEYSRALNSINQDCLIMANIVLNMDIPATGDFEYGGIFTIPASVPGTTGMLGRLTSGADVDYRYGFYLDISGSLIIATGLNEIMTVANFTTNYVGQKIKVSVKYEGSEVVLLIDDLETAREVKARPSTGTDSFFVGAYGNINGITPRDGRYYNDKVHSIYYGNINWSFNERSGFDCTSDVGNYVVTGQTSNAGGLSYWVLNVITKET